MLVFNVLTLDKSVPDGVIRFQIPVDFAEKLVKADNNTEKGMILGCFDDADNVDFKLIWPDKESKKNGLSPSISESMENVDHPDGFYDFYIKSKKWRGKRIERLKIDDFRCARCGSEINLQVHHLNYENLGNEDVENDLVTLCRKCHAELHGKET